MKLTVGVGAVWALACATVAPIEAPREPSWPVVARQVEHSVRPLVILGPTGVLGGCTVFRVNGIYLTAYHCVDHEHRLSVLGVAMTVTDHVDDVASLWPAAPIVGWPSLRLASGLARGEAVAMLGYAMGSDTILFAAGHVITPGDRALDRLFSVPASSYFTAPVWVGNSGGPVVNARGEVVSLVQGRYNLYGGFYLHQGAAFETVRRFVG